MSGLLSPEDTRQRLKYAIKSKNKKLLDAAIKESTSSGLPGLHSEIQEARETLHKLKSGKGGLPSPDAIRGHLRSALEVKSRSHLEKAIMECEQACYPELSLDLRHARDTLERMGFGRGG